MSIAMACPGCGHILYAPAGSGGKKAQCTRCPQKMRVPHEEPATAESDFEIIEVEPPPRPSSRPRPSLNRQDDYEVVEDRPRRRDRDEDEQDRTSPRRRPSLTTREDDDNDGPRRNSRRKKKAKSGEGATNVILGILGTVLVVIFVVVMVVAKVGRGARLGGAVARLVNNDNGNETSTAASGTPSSSSWVTYNGDGFSGSFPGGPPVHDAKLTSQLSRQNSATALSRRDGTITYAVMLIATDDTSQLNDQQQKLMIDTVSNAMAQSGAGTERNSDMVLFGRPGKEMVIKMPRSRMVFRMVLMSSRLVMYAVEGPNLTADHANVTRFLNEFNVTR